jgi:hypothetical protein
LFDRSQPGQRISRSVVSARDHRPARIVFPKLVAEETRREIYAMPHLVPTGSGTEIKVGIANSLRQRSHIRGRASKSAGDDYFFRRSLG